MNPVLYSCLYGWNRENGVKNQTQKKNQKTKTLKMQSGMFGKKKQKKNE